MFCADFFLKKERTESFLNPILFFRKFENLSNLLVNNDIVTQKVAILKKIITENINGVKFKVILFKTNK